MAAQWSWVSEGKYLDLVCPSHVFQVVNETRDVEHTLEWCNPIMIEDILSPELLNLLCKTHVALQYRFSHFGQMENLKDRTRC